MPRRPHLTNSTHRRLAAAAAAVVACVALAGDRAVAEPQFFAASDAAPALPSVERSEPTTKPAARELPPLPEVESDPFADSAVEAVVPDTSADQDQSVRYDAAADTVDIRVSNGNLVDVLRMLAEQSERNIVASKNVGGVVSCSLYDVTVREALDAILASNDLGVKEEGRFLYVYTQEELAELEEADRRVETRVFRLYHTPPSMAARMIAPALSEQAIVSLSDETEIGVGSNASNAGGYGYSAEDVLVVSDFPERLAEVERLLDDVDQRPQQVLVEATILSSTLTDNNQLGVDFNLVGGVDFNQVNFLPGGQIASGGFDDNAQGNGGGEVYGGGTGNNFAGAVPGGLKLGFVSGDVSVFLSALEGVTDSTVLANPKVLTLNKQRGEVLVGREDGYVTTTLTETSATQDVQFLKTGTSLVFRPFISRDGYVRLEIHPEDSSGGVDARGLPSKVTTEVTSNVMVKDGHTIVIGGLFRESSVVSKSQVPVLGNIPLLGRAFGRQADSSVREEIIILLTPHVVKDDDKYAALGDQERLRAERLRVGTRRGMMFWGRERQAQANYQKAVENLAKEEPNRSRALFHLNAALHLDPSFLEAIELKEKLTGEAVVSADGSSIRSFVRRSIRDDITELQGDEVAPGDDLPPDDPKQRQPRDMLPDDRKDLVKSDIPATRPDAFASVKD